MRISRVLLMAIFILFGFHIAYSEEIKKKPMQKLNIPEITVGESLKTFEERRSRLLLGAMGINSTTETIADPKQDVYGARAIANLYHGKFEEAANSRIRRTAEWFEHEHPRGRPLNEEPDFAAEKLCLAYYLFRNTNKLEPATVERIKQYFFTKDFRSKHNSENHHLLSRTAGYLMAQAFPDENFAAYRKYGKEVLAEGGEWLKTYIRFRAKRGWGEFDSTGYIGVAFECLPLLHDFAEDEELRRLCEMMLDLLLADMAVDSLHGLYGGAHGRTYQVHNHSTAVAYRLQDLYFGNVDPNVGAAGAVLETLVCSYRPSQILVDLGMNRPEPYENFERKHLHNTRDVMPKEPLDGSIRKYTWYTPEFLMGCVQRQDPYPEGVAEFDWYARHQQQEWDLSIGTRATSRVFTHHPGDSGTHAYWIGDTRCRCGSFFQNKGALISLYDIPAKEPFQYIHAYVPKDSFDEIVEENGVIFIREGEVCAALRLLNGYEWTTEGDWKDREVIGRGNKHGVICEAALLTEAGSFENFRKEFAGNKVDFDPTSMTLTYESSRYGKLRMNSQGLRELNDNNANLDYPTWGNPYMRSPWDSGVVEITKGGRQLLLDFPAARSALKDQ